MNDIVKYDDKGWLGFKCLFYICGVLIYCWVVSGLGVVLILDGNKVMVFLLCEGNLFGDKCIVWLLGIEFLKEICFDVLFWIDYLILF